MKQFFVVIIFLLFSMPVFAYKYDFSQEDYNEFIKKVYNLKVPKGAKIHSQLNANISSVDNKLNDQLTTQLVRDWSYDGKIVAPEGSLIIGKIQKIRNSNYATINAEIEINFFKIIRPDGVEIDIVSKPIVIKSGKSSALQCCVMILTGAASGYFQSPSNSLSNQLISLAYGATQGGWNFINTKGEEVTIPLGTTFNINTVEPITVSPYEF